MKFKLIIISVYIILLCSCEQLKEFNSPKSENNESSNVPASVPGNDEPSRKVDEVDSSISKNEPPVIKTIVSAPPPEKPESSIIKTKVKPEQPEISPELLSAVKNWQLIPKSVFPLSAVTINQPIEFVAKTQSGQIIATALKKPGDEVVAVGSSGKYLSVAPSVKTKMRGQILLEQTDFKQGVAYLFELRKKQREDYERKKADLAELGNSSDDSLSRETSTQEQASLFEDLPIPGDFGHGKFCICKDCRDKRLAATGSMK